MVRRQVRSLAGWIGLVAGYIISVLALLFIIGAMLIGIEWIWGHLF